MKRYNLILTLSIMILLSACANVEKMVDRGNYDQAIQIATKRLAGKKAKKEKYVQAAEEAFAKVTKRDMDRIAQLKLRNGLEDWKKIHAISGDMLRRQTAIEPLLPLIGKEGYHAGFSFVRAEVIRNEAAAIVSGKLYENANQALAAGRQNNKLAARDAYALFSQIGNYNRNYKSTNSLMQEAEALGITHVLVRLENKTPYILPRQMERELLSFYNTGRQSQWKQFHVSEHAVDKVDFLSKVVVNQLDISPERLDRVIHHFHKQVDEVQYARDENGRVLRDTLGKKIEILVPRNVRAEVVEISQAKEAVVDMVVEIFDHDSRRLINRERMQAIGNFQNDACRIQGDRRAVEGRWLNLGEPIPFPTDEALILTAADQLKEEVTDYLIRFPFEQS